MDHIPGLRRTVIWSLTWGILLGGTAFFVGVYGALATRPGNNLAPMLGYVLGTAAAIGGLLAGACISMFRRLSNWHLAALLLVVATLMGSSLMVWMWSNRSSDDSEVLAKRIIAASRTLRLSEGLEETVRFQPPAEAGQYLILIAGAETPSTIPEEHIEGLTVTYPLTPGGGPTWGQGRSWSYRSSVVVPVTLRVEKGAGMVTEIVLRSREASIELVELR